MPADRPSRAAGFPRAHNSSAIRCVSKDADEAPLATAGARSQAGLPGAGSFGDSSAGASEPGDNTASTQGCSTGGRRIRAAGSGRQDQGRQDQGRRIRAEDQEPGEMRRPASAGTRAEPDDRGCRQLAGAMADARRRAEPADRLAVLPGSGCAREDPQAQFDSACVKSKGRSRRGRLLRGRSPCSRTIGRATTWEALRGLGGWTSGRQPARRGRLQRIRGGAQQPRIAGSGGTDAALDCTPELALNRTFRRSKQTWRWRCWRVGSGAGWGIRMAWRRGNWRRGGAIFARRKWRASRRDGRNLLIHAEQASDTCSLPLCAAGFGAGCAWVWRCSPCPGCCAACPGD